MCLWSDQSSDLFLNLQIIVKNTLWDLTKYLYLESALRDLQNDAKFLVKLLVSKKFFIKKFKFCKKSYFVKGAY